MTTQTLQFEEPQPRVLVIDDSQDVHRLLKARLRHEEMELVAAATALEGLEAARTGRPAIILLDLDMPDMDGFELMRRLKDDPTTLNIPVIVLSSLQSAQDKVMAFDLGAVDYITKPFNLTELRVRVRSALRMHRLVRMLAQRAQIDGLTGLWNRAFFDRRWADELSGCQRHNRQLSLALMDVDHFKSVNDTYGHPAGDSVLQGLAKILQRECRQEDIACRYGGEEFALIMPDTAMGDAVQVCERIRQVLQEASWPRHPERPVSISIGVVGAASVGEIPASRWIEQADQNLYTAKRTGRNRVVHSPLMMRPTLAAAG